MSYMVDKSPAQDKLLQRQVRIWEPKEHRPTLTWSRSGYKPYSTYVVLRWPLWIRAKAEQSQAQVRAMDARGQGSTVEGCRHIGIVYTKNGIVFSARLPILKLEIHWTDRHMLAYDVWTCPLRVKAFPTAPFAALLRIALTHRSDVYTKLPE
jgi:hypothetical protein